MTNFERIKNMTPDELAMFLMKVNCAYAEDCMIFDCKYPNINNNCAICFKEWLEKEYNTKMIIREEQRDLFTVPADYILVHCISADFAMGAGIAKEFTRRGVKAQLIENYHGIAKVGDCAVTTTTGWRLEFNLVTKEKYWQKPTYGSLKTALVNARILALMNDDEPVKLAMPRIGCGLDRLQWVKVKEIIEEVFANTDVEILVCVK